MKQRNIIEKNEIALPLKEKMQQLIKENNFVEAMDVMAQLAVKKIMDIDVMYMGAYCYMMTGDTERAVKWINNVLSYNPKHVPARILLARLCIANGKTDEGLKIFSFIIENMQDVITENDKNELLDNLDIYRYNDSDMIMEEYPVIAKFLGLEEKEHVSQEIIVEVQPQEEVQSIEEDSQAVQNARKAVERLRQLLNRNKQTKEEAVSVEAKVVEEEKIREESSHVEEISAKEIKEEVDNKFDVEGVCQQVMAKPVSLKEKVKLFNSFAAGCYVNGDYQSAFELLSAALQIDEYDPVLLKNIAYVCIAAGEQDQAMDYASKLPMIDFALLHDIKG